MHTTKVSTKGWIVIPKALRKKHRIAEGTRIQIVEYGDILALVPLPDDPARALHGMLKDGPSLTADLLSEHAREIEHEESRNG
jgi:AbrB family looped-hinge helix DNA binding protein